MDCLRLILPNLQSKKSNGPRGQPSVLGFWVIATFQQSIPSHTKAINGLHWSYTRKIICWTTHPQSVWCFFVFWVFPVFFVPLVLYRLLFPFCFCSRVLVWTSRSCFFFSFRVPKTFQIFPLSWAPFFQKYIHLKPEEVPPGGTQVSLTVSKNPRCTLGAEPMLMDRTS